MNNVLTVAYLLIVLAMVAVILLQRSEGGGLGMGGNAGGLMTVRGSANLLTRTTAVLAALFFATAIGLTILAEVDRGTKGIVEQAATPQPGADGTAVPTNVLDALTKLQTENAAAATTPAPATTPATDPGLAVPATTAPAADAPAAPAQ